MKKMILPAFIAALFLTACSQQAAPQTVPESQAVTNETIEDTTEETSGSTDGLPETETGSQTPEMSAASEASCVESAPEEASAADSTQEDMFYLASGMTKADAAAFLDQLLSDIKSGNREAVSALFHYPEKVTTASGEVTVNNAEELLPWYDEIFTEEFLTALENEDREDLHSSDGLISFGTGMIWILPPYGDRTTMIFSVNGLDGSSVRPDGPQGITAG